MVKKSGSRFWVCGQNIKHDRSIERWQEILQCGAVYHDVQSGCLLSLWMKP